MAKRIAIVDDDKKIVALLKTYFEKEGFIVYEAYDGTEGLRLIQDKTPDIAVLDVMLPQLDGFEICRRLRREGNIPIIMLTARDEETDKLIGLELGADDYVVKPFSPREVVARVKAILRRSGKGTEESSGVIIAGRLAIDRDRHVAKIDDVPLELTPTEFKLLALLAGNPKRVFSRLQIIEHIQGYSFEGYERTVDAHVKNLRRKLGNAQYIQTVYGIGYKFLPAEAEK
ncbi:response regulator transcription factor [Sporolituus thermophilus]|uniref:DNA-binding response regulator, OmpR family, contains REC and winged-helix (WHTH) domain n=1 Tax=Sporolituus thermophilus DSM 23256 TaxID=1123285 RepID=A0A1G7IPM9_9FIRM|nr:response regulator transcription factor [Sporolituus thermophilus]SDF14504.1 DNA-binding response regulator, OmpR family, contains REC and winged-helix (wHTH) domain [Sporolituus thermophilus DSM 23256]